MSKFGFETDSTHHLIAKLKVDGKVVVKTRRSNQQGDLPSADKIRQQLRLNQTQFRAAIRCTLSRDDYLGILESKGILGDSD